MKIQKSQKSKLNKVKIACFVLVLVLVGAGLCYLLVLRGSGSSTDSSDSSSSSKPTKQQESEQAVSDSKKKEDYLNSNPDDSAPPAETSSSDGISMVISQDGDKVVVSTNLGYISRGSCKLTVGSYSSTVDILYQPAYSTCMGFSIGRNQLQTGHNTFKLEVAYGNTTLTKTEAADIK
jgi:hypothetical protein